MVIIVQEPEILSYRTHLYAIAASCSQRAGNTAHSTTQGWDIVTCHIATIVDQVRGVDDMLEGSPL